MHRKFKFLLSRLSYMSRDIIKNKTGKEKTEGSLAG